MYVPKMRVRPGSQQSQAAFKGIYHNPTAPIGTWYDSRNLSSDLSPTVIPRRERRTVSAIDGNEVTRPIVAMCGGDHPVLLDEAGYYWCNGHSKQGPYGPGEAEAHALRYSIQIYHWVQAEVEITPTDGVDESWTALNGLGVSQDGAGSWGIDQQRIRFRCVEDLGPGHDPLWECDLGGAWVQSNPADYNIIVTADNLIDGLMFDVLLYDVPVTLLGPGHRLLRMGARVVDTTANVWIDAVALAAGAETVETGKLGVNTVGGNITLTMVNMDGEPYSGITVGATEPSTSYWLDTSGDKPVLREWQAAYSMWAVITSTFIKIHLDDMEQGADVEWPNLRQFDTVKLTAGNLPADTDKAVTELLNSWHYLYALDFAAGSMDMIVSGIIPEDSIEIPTGSLTIDREIPAMDYVVEAGNRLWGCRYSEAEGINEIYASSLGDPANWHVYQGLSTDSWTASRGTAAPFTGAAVLNGNPLFFRADSLEKVYISSSGAHQIQSFDLEGVEPGAANSLCVIADRLIYKSRLGVMAYTGTMPQRISDALGDMVFRGGSAARHRGKYCLATLSEAGEPVVLAYDLQTGDWHIESDGWYRRRDDSACAVTWQDDLYYIEDGSIWTMDNEQRGLCSWWAETAPQAIRSGSESITAHKWISYLRVRYRMLSPGIDQTCKLRILMAYEDGPWELKREFTGADIKLKTWELNILPRRKDNFRLRFEGEGPVEIFDICWRMEQSEAHH